MLVTHPQIARAERKELHFFDDESRDWSSPDYTDYHHRIVWPHSATIAGEGTPNYVFWPGAMDRIRAYNADMRLVLSFRDPVDRAFSQWRMMRLRRPDTPSFADAIRDVRPTRWPRTAEEAGKANRSYVGFGYYGQQLAHVLELFPAEQVLALDFHRLFADVPAALDRITDLLGVHRFSEPPTEFRRRVQQPVFVPVAPTTDDVSMLVELYVDDLAEFARLSGLEISHWPTWQVVHGGLSAADLADQLSAKAGLAPNQS